MNKFNDDDRQQRWYRNKSKLKFKSRTKNEKKNESKWTEINTPSPSQTAVSRSIARIKTKNHWTFTFHFSVWYLKLFFYWFKYELNWMKNEWMNELFYVWNVKKNELKWINNDYDYWTEKIIFETRWDEISILRNKNYHHYDNKRELLPDFFSIPVAGKFFHTHTHTDRQTDNEYVIILLLKWKI